jgi:hypothetical protein
MWADSYIAAQSGCRSDVSGGVDTGPLALMLKQHNLLLTFS